MTDVFVHIGLPKTGTTTLQAALDASADDLARVGVLYPGGREAQRLAAFDLVGQRIEGDERQVAGALGRLVEEIDAHEGGSAVFSDEELGFARPRQVRRLVQALGDHRVFVVVGVRDTARTLVSSWQQTVAMGSTHTWREYVGGVRDVAGDADPAADGEGAVSEGTRFWLRHDVLRAMDVWGTAVPADRIRVVTVPPRGGDPAALLQRFAAAVELPEGVWDGLEPGERNVSFGAAELEVLRRLNGRVTETLPRRQYRWVVEHGLRPQSTAAPSRPLVLPPEHLAWAQERDEHLVAELGRRGVEVFGDPGDLRSAEAPADARHLDDVTPDELLAASEALLSSLTVAHGKLFGRYRQAFSKAEGRAPSAADLLGSSARSAAFKVKRMAHQKSNDSKVLGKAARWYARRPVGRDDR